MWWKIGLQLVWGFLKKYPWPTLVLGLLVAIFFLSRQLKSAWNDQAIAEHSANISNLNMLALEDTNKVWRDSVQTLAERLALQQVPSAVPSGSSGNGAPSHPKANIPVVVAPKPDSGAMQLPAAKDTTVELHGPSISGDIHVQQNPLALSYKLYVEPIALNVDVQCTNQHAADVLVRGPTWTNLAVGMGRIDPEVCNPTPTNVVRGGWSTTTKIEVVGGSLFVGTALGLALHAIIH